MNPKGFTMNPMGLIMNPMGLLMNPKGFTMNPMGFMDVYHVIYADYKILKVSLSKTDL